MKMQVLSLRYSRSGESLSKEVVGTMELSEEEFGKMCTTAVTHKHFTDVMEDFKEYLKLQEEVS